MVTLEQLRERTRPFQTSAIERGAARKHSLLWSPPGSGKTLMGMGIHRALDVQGPTLIVGSRPALSSWARQLPIWLDIDPDQILHIRGSDGKTIKERKWKSYKDYLFVLCTYEMMVRSIKECLLPHSWPMIIADEFHKVRNRARSAWLNYKTLECDAEVLMTGTEMRRGAADAFTTFARLDKKLWKSYWRYVGIFCETYHNGFGQEIIGPKNTKRFAAEVERMGTWYTKADLADQMPTMNKMFLDVEMHPKIENIYLRIENDLYAELPSNGIIATPNEMTALLRLRQLLVCPKILDPDLPYGEGIEAMLEIYDEQPHLAIYTPFRSAIPWIVTALLEHKIPEESINVLEEGISAERLNEKVSRFLKHKGVLIGTIQTAEAYSLSTCDTSVFLGYDWSWDVNEQAEDRIRRLDSSSDYVNVYYVRHMGTVDEAVMENVIMNKRNVNRYAAFRKRRIS